MAEVGRWAEGHEKDPARFPSSLPPYDHVVDLLEGEFLTGLRKSDIQCTETIFRTKLLDIADKLAKDAPLAQVWQEFKTSLRERSDLPGATEFDNSTLLYLYLSVLPTTMYNMLRHVKDGNGNVRDPSDHVVLENSILNLTEVWQEELRRRRSGGDKLSSLIGGGAGPSRSGAGQNTKKGHDGASGSGSSPNVAGKRPWSQVQGKGGSAKGTKWVDRYPGMTWKYSDPKVQKCWIAGLTQAKVATLRGKCLLCEQPGHEVLHCPKQKACFESTPRTFFAYNRQQKQVDK